MRVVAECQGVGQQIPILWMVGAKFPNGGEESAVESLGLAVALRVIGSRHFGLDSEGLVDCLHELAREVRTVVGQNGFRRAEGKHPVAGESLRQVKGLCRPHRYGHYQLGEPIDDYQNV